MINKKIMIAAFIFLALPLASAAHYVVGYVENAKDGTIANGREVVLWNPLNGQSDNVTDIVGPTGNSGADNIYMMDCELLGSPCQIGDTIHVKVVDDGNGYVSNEVSVQITGAGYDLANNLSLNSPPSFSGVNVDDFQSLPENEIDLIPATTKKVECKGIITDYEGENSITNVSSQFFDSSNSYYGDFDDNNYHYSNYSCMLNKSYGNNNEIEVICSYEIFYYANPGNWNCIINSEDNYSASNTGNDSSKINELLALGVDSPLYFGELSAEEVSGEKEVNVTNYGNVKINLSLSGYAKTPGDGYAMNCSSGVYPNIPIEYEKYNLSSSTNGNLSLTEFENHYSNLTSNPVVKKFNLDSRKDDFLNEAVNKTYWRIYLPKDAGGSCQGNIVFGAVQSNGN